MGEDITDIYSASAIDDLDDKTVFVAFDVKDGMYPDGICMRIRLPHVRNALPLGFVKLLRLRLASGTRVLLPGPPHLLGSSFRACNVGPLLESIAHHFAVVQGR
jgi:hypothetical protein